MTSLLWRYVHEQHLKAASLLVSHCHCLSSRGQLSSTHGFLLVSECQQIHSSDATCPPCDHLTPQQLRLPSSSLFTYCVLLCIVTQELLIHLSCLGLVGLERRLSCSCLSSDFSSVIDYKVRWFQPVHTFRYPGLSYVRTEHRSQMIGVLDCCNLPLLWCMLVLMSCVDFWASVGRICV